MLGHRALTPEDYGAILKRRGWIIAVPIILLPLIAFGITFLVTPKYVSQTLVLVEQPKVPDEYVKPLMEEDLSGRLATMKEQILSRSRLQPIIERFNLYSTNKMTMDDRIEQTRKDIDIKPIHSEISRAGGLPGFFIAFTAGDARTAQLVCGEITSLFVSENLSDRTASAEGTTNFLKQQLADAKQNLDQQDAKLADFQRTNAGKLPGQEEANMNMLNSLTGQLDSVTQTLTRMEQDKTYVEALISQQSRDYQTPEQQKVLPQEQQAELQTLLAQEADLSARYTSDYPDVVSVRRKIKDLRDTMAKAPAAPPPSPSPVVPTNHEPANLQQMRAQLRAQELGITDKKREQGEISEQIRNYQARIQSSPAVQEQFKDLTRDYQTAQAFYTQLLEKMNQSKMATDLEKRQQGEQFTIMDEPNLPEEPAFPKRGLFVGIGAGAGLTLGLLLVGLLEYRDTAVRSERDIWAFTKLPTLAVIEFTLEAEQVSTKRWWKFGQHKTEIAAGGKPLMNAGG